MQHEYVCLVHYHELGLKGHNRSRFERQLRENIKAALADAYPQARVSRISGRELVDVGSLDEAKAVARIIALIPGVVRVSCGVRCARELDAINEVALDLVGSEEPFNTFKVDARRANTDFPVSSMEMNRLVGAYLCERLPEKGVRMREPDVCVHVEVIQGQAFVYTHSVRAVGGLPVGSSGRVLCLLSAGLDSPVAAWRMMRRGALVTGLHFSGAPETPDTSEYLVREIAAVLRPAAGLTRLAIVRFGGYQREIARIVPPELRVIFYRRLMFAVANRVALLEGAGALVTGESLGQVASQTLDNIRATDAVAELPVLRPLIGSDKQEIIDEAQRLGTYEVSIRNHDDCCTLFMPRNPETHAKLDVVEPIWAELPVNDWLDAILTDLQIEQIL
jgi:thiamine biosynthesis protein ThiI